jgi:tripartite-type tricarboxylate transporter receptor subunit TctC
MMQHHHEQSMTSRYRRDNLNSLAIKASRRMWLSWRLTFGMFAMFSGVIASVAHAQANYPSKPIKMIVPLAAGSAVDNAARIVAAKMSQGLGQSIVIENQVGASGQIGAENVAKAAPDGYTIGGFNDSIMTMLPQIKPNLPWDILRDFTPISLVATVEWGLIANNDVPYKNAAGLIAAATKAPGQINYGSGGSGSPQHIAMALFAAQAGLSMTHVPYKGATQAAVGVAGGEVPVAFQGLATVATLVRGGKLRLLGVTTKERLAQFPDVPTIGESGLPGFEFNSWFAMLAPAGTPNEVVSRLNAEMRKALADPDVRDKLIGIGLSPRGSSPQELANATREQLAKYGRLFKQAGIKAD